MSLPNKQSMPTGATVETLSDVLKTFTIDYWYKMLILVSVGFAFVALTMQIHVISNGALLLLSLGGFLIGTGEWVNHPYRERISLEYSAKISGHPRSPKIGGVALDVVGGLLALAALAKIVLQAAVSA
jgi:hypothetical protein